MAQQARTQTIFRPANIVWGILLVFAIVSILFPLYIMFKYSVADKDSFVTGGKYAAPLWPFDPNLDQYRELVGGECFKLTAASLDTLQNEGLPDTIMTGLRVMESDTCAVKSEFTTELDSNMKAAFQFSEAALQHLEKAGVPAATVRMLENVLDEKPLAEKKFLKAIEQQSTFLLTDRAFDKLRKRKVPEAVVAELSALRGQEFILERDYLSAVTERIGQESLTKYRKNLLKYAEGTEVGRAQLVQFKALFLQHGFIGWQNG